MRRIRRCLPLFLSCLLLGCQSSGVQQSVPIPDAAPLDTPASSVSPSKADANPSLPDAKSTGSVVVDTGISVAETAPDSAMPAMDSRAPDAAKVIADGRLPDSAKVEPDTAAPTTPSPDAPPLVVDSRPAGTSFHCPADAGPATLGRLSPLELKTLLDGGENPFLINVKGESIGKIPGTDAVLVNDIAGIETLVGRDTCANIILYCQSGNTSQTVASQLLAKGYRRIRDLTGGITAWKAAGYPTL